MKRLKMQRFGTKVQGVRLYGNPENPEPIYVTIKFPGGEVYAARVENEETGEVEYWAHVSVNSKSAGGYDPFIPSGTIVDRRADKTTAEAFDHVAFRIASEPAESS
jgi:hypothetical protein